MKFFINFERDSRDWAKLITEFLGSKILFWDPLGFGIFFLNATYTWETYQCNIYSQVKFKLVYIYKVLSLYSLYIL